MNLQLHTGRYTVAKLKSLPYAMPDGLFFLARTRDEISLVCREEAVPPDAIDAEAGWVVMEVKGPLDFALTGILARLTAALAEAEIPVFAVSTFDTDYLLVKEELAEKARIALEGAENQFLTEPL